MSVLPNTKLDERLNPDGTPKDWSKPINKVDEICMQHDKNYNLADQGQGTRHEADKVMLDQLNELKNKDLTWSEYFAKNFTKGVIGLKYKLGLGIYDNIQLAKEPHKPIVRKFRRRRVMIFNIDDIWSADLHDMSKISKFNKGYTYLLNVIDLFGRYAHSIPLKTKTSKEVLNAFESLFNIKQPNKLWTDQGSEFINKNFKQFLSDRNIELYHVYNEGKACMIERFNRTLGEMIQKYLTSHQTEKYIDVLQKLVDEYNNKTHSTIKMSPVDASKFENHDDVLQNISADVSDKKSRPKYKIGDRVRVTVYKNKFDKGTKPKWTTEIFVITKVLNTDPITYKIKDLNNEDILGSFYTQELQHSEF